jgi:hypothetical protein
MFGGETNLGRTRREQVLARDAPEDFPLVRAATPAARGRCCAVDGGVATAGDSMQMPQRQPAARHPPVVGLNSKSECGPGARRRPSRL